MDRLQMWHTLRARRQEGRPPAAILSLDGLLDGSPVALVPPSALLGERLRHQLTAMRFESGLPEEEFESDIKGAILACADWVQQLPASRNESHREPGGLVRMAVECAAVSLRRADGTIFPTPGRGLAGGVMADTAWRYAAVLAALFVSVGRGVAHWQVHTADGNHRWNPYSQGLHRWLPTVGARQYRIGSASPAASVSRAGAGAWIAARCLDERRLTRLEHGEGHILGALVDVLGGHKESTLGRIIEDALGAVIAEDRNRARQHPGRPPASTEQQLLSVIRDLAQCRWTVNTPDGRVWAAADGVFLAWRPAAADILARWRAKFKGGEDMSARALAALLLEHGLLERNPDAAPGAAAEWPCVLQLSDAEPQMPVVCVRLTDPRIFALNLVGKAPVRLRIEEKERPQPVAVPVQDAATSPQEDPPLPESPPEWLDKQDEEGKQSRQRPNGADRKGRARTAPAPKRTAARRETAPDKHMRAAPQDVLPALARYGEVGRVLSRLAMAEQRALAVLPEGIAVPYSAVKELMQPKAFIEQCRIQAILAEDGPRAGEPAGPGPKEPYILLAPHVGKAMGVSTAEGGAGKG